MKLYTFHRSSAAYRVRIALHLKGLSYDCESCAFATQEHRSAEYLAINPYGLIPALQMDSCVLVQSCAIIEYLDERYPSPALLPPDLIGRAIVRSMALAIACDIHPLNNLRVLNYLRTDLAQDEEHINTWYRNWVTQGFVGLEAQARQHSTQGRFCFGGSLSLADVCLVPQMYNARRFSTDLSPFPTLESIAKHLESIPAFESARPEVQPDAS